MPGTYLVKNWSRAPVKFAVIIANNDSIVAEDVAERLFSLVIAEQLADSLIAVGHRVVHRWKASHLPCRGSTCERVHRLH